MANTYESATTVSKKCYGDKAPNISIYVSKSN